MLLTSGLMSFNFLCFWVATQLQKTQKIKRHKPIHVTYNPHLAKISMNVFANFGKNIDKNEIISTDKQIFQKNYLELRLLKIILYVPIFYYFWDKLKLMSIRKEIEITIKNSDKGKLFFISDFSCIGEYETIRKSLQRLTKQKLILRLSKGIYYYPKQDKILGIIYPSSEQIAKAIAKRDKARIIPTGSYALYLLGLSTQIPMNVVYLSDGSARKINIGKQIITFKKTSPKNLAINHELSSLIIQALKTIGENNITENECLKIKQIMENSKEIEKITENIKFAPVWIQKTILQIIKKIANENLA